MKALPLRSRPWARRWLPLVLLFAMLVTLAAPPSVANAAPAAGRAWNTKTMWLQYPAPPGANHCFSRRIYLAAGTYRWNPGSGFHGWDFYGRNITLSAGWYTWKDCLNRWERAGDPVPGGTYRFVYVQDSYLIQDGRPAGAQERGWLQPGTCCPTQPKQYHVTWGSSLRRL